MAIRMPWIRLPGGRDLFAPEERAVPQQRSSYNNGYGSGLNSGGVMNMTTGLGTSLDKGTGTFFAPTRIYWRTPLEVLGNESWVARNAIDIPNDDYFIRWREHRSDDPAAAEAMMMASDELDLEVALNRALKNGDQYGTGIVIMLIDGQALEDELDVRTIREGDLKALHYFDRYDLSVKDRENDIMSKNFRRPTHYVVHPNYSGPPFYVHHSRVLRFDGIPNNTVSGSTVYHYDFGTSVFVPILTSIMEDSSGASAIAHLMQEASIPLLNIAGLRESIAGMGDPNEPTPQQIFETMNRMKSNYRIMALDEVGREQFTRVAVAFSGLADICNMFMARVAAARKIPQTRFLGSPPSGMNATGESDMKNYVMMMEAKRERMLKAPLLQLDKAIARHVGIRDDPPEYEWMSLLEMSDTEIATAFKTKMEGMKIGLESFVWDEDEVRKAMNGDPSIGELTGLAPEAPDPIEMMEAEAKAKASARPPASPAR